VYNVEHKVSRGGYLSLNSESCPLGSKYGFLLDELFDWDVKAIVSSKVWDALKINRKHEMLTFYSTTATRDSPAVTTSHVLS